MQEPPVMKWNKVMHKAARTEDGQLVGYIAANDDESVIILTSGFREYSIPKSSVKAFDGSQVYLDFHSNELEKYWIT